MDYFHVLVATDGDSRLKRDECHNWLRDKYPEMYNSPYSKHFWWCTGLTHKNGEFFIGYMFKREYKELAASFKLRFG